MIFQLTGPAFWSFISIIIVHALTEDEEKMTEYYKKLEKMYANLPKFDIKIVYGNLNAKIGRKEMYGPVGMSTYK